MPEKMREKNAITACNAIQATMNKTMPANTDNTVLMKEI